MVTSQEKSALAPTTVHGRFPQSGTSSKAREEDAFHVEDVKRHHKGINYLWCFQIFHPFSFWQVI